MASPQQKLVKVGDDIVVFPGDMENDHIAKLVKSFHEKKKKIQPVATEESEHARQLKTAQPLSTAIPSVPDWTNKPFVSDKDLEETPKGKAITAKSQKEFETAHPQITSVINKGNNPVVLGALSGTNEFVKGMQTPASMALLLGAPESKILSGIFSVQALRGSYKDAQSARKAFDEGKNEEAIKYVTQALLGAGVGALAGTHAYKGLPEGVRTKLASEEGSVQHPDTNRAIMSAINAAKNPRAMPDLKDVIPGEDDVLPVGWKNGRLVEVPVNDPRFTHENAADVIPDPHKVKQYASLSQSTMPPIEAIYLSDGRLGLTDGMHRLAAARLRGDDTVKVWIDERDGLRNIPSLVDVKKKAVELKPTTAYQAADQSQPFYLKSENLINEKMKGPMPAEDVHKMLLSNGVKPEEMQWTGLDDLLKSKGKGKVTPQEVQEHLAANNLQIHEVMKGTGGLIFHQSFPTQEALMNVVNGDEMLVDKEGKLRKGLAVEQSQQGWNLYDSSTKENPTKFGSYVLPGGENYRELLLTMPPRRMTFDQWRDMIQARTGDRVPDNEAERKAYQADVDYRALREGADFRSSHWDEPNVLGHVRMNDRTGPNGEKILHIEELQSDMMQGMRSERTKIDAAVSGEGFYDIIKKMEKDGTLEIEC